MKIVLGIVGKRLFSSSVNPIPKQPNHNGSLLKKVAALVGCATITGLSWRYYEQNYYQTELSREYFTKYRISRKQTIDQDHYLIQLQPLKPQRTNLWSTMGSSKLWSVEVKQPEIMVVRSYTPLPLMLNENGSVDVLKDGENANGALTFYIKKYKQGEVARWINSLPIGYVLELRGPYIEYEIPEIPGEVKRDRSFLWDDELEAASQKFQYQPIDLLFLSGGTGIVPLLQMTLTESPFRGKIAAFHSCKSKTELGPLEGILNKLSSNGRIKLHLYESQDASKSFRNNLNSIKKLIPAPYPYNGPQPFKSIDPQLKPVLALVCGPEGFISTVSGAKLDSMQGPVSGILGSRGWNNSNVYKLS